MKFDQYISLIQQLEISAAANRRLYEYKVFGLALLGYLYFAAVIVLFLIVPVMLILLFAYNRSEFVRILLLAAKLWWVFVPLLGVYFGFVGGALKSMTAKVPEPSGDEVTAEQAPELFEFVRTTSKSLRSQLPEKVFITDEFNAAVVTAPRIGIFGRKVYIRLGLPLMRALSPEQFKAVLAHEIGHISGKHGGFSKWTYQLHEAWGRFIESQEAHEHKFAALYEKFVGWFFPYFSAYSFVLMREHEKEADRYAVELVGAQPLAEALITLETRGSDIHEVFWKGIHEENIVSEVPPDRLFSKMVGSLAFVESGRHAATLKKALERPTDYEDSHPSLAERLRLMEYVIDPHEPKLPPIAGTDSAEFFLGSQTSQFADQFDQVWDESVRKSWKDVYKRHQETQKRFEELQSRSEENPLTPEEMLESAGLLAEKKGNAEALSILERSMELYPDHAETAYSLGGVLLSIDDERGLEYLNKAIELDPAWKLAASDAAFAFLRGKGRFDEAKKYAAGIENEQDNLDKAKKERSSVTFQDRFELHALSAEAAQTIVAKLNYFEEISTIYLVRKIVKYFPNVPCHVLFIELRPPRKQDGVKDLNGAEIIDIAVDRLREIEINFFVTLDGSNAGFRPDLEAIDGAKIFSR